MQDNTKDSGSTTSETAKDSKDTPMVTLILDSSSMEKHMEKVYILGKMVRSTMVSGIKESSKAMEYGKVSGTILILGSGHHQKLMDMEYTTGLMETVMKDSGTCVLSMVKEQTHLLMETNIQVITLMVSQKGKESMCGLLDKFTLVIS